MRKIDSMILKPREPFNFHRTLRFILSPPSLLNGRSFAPLLDYFVAGEFRRVIEVEGEPVLYGVSERDARSGGGLRVRILQGPSHSAARRAVLDSARTQLAVDFDLNPFYTLAALDPVLSRLVVHFRGMRIPQVANPYEALVSAILEQQVNLSFAHQVKRALIETHGRFVEFEGSRYNLFPNAAALAIRTPQDLRKLQISGPKARYILAISQAIVDGSFDLGALRSLEASAAQEKLLSLKGVGAWTAHYVAMRALGGLDCLPAADVGLQKSIQFFYGLRKQPAIPRVEALARKWAGWRSYATFYLWLTYWEETSWKENLRAEIRALKNQKAP
ncbi:MAG TPA: hypothetical protein VFZ08_14640 [Terriglobia bacterium]|nr:hypothetical protein [Terriglobia bacterium]